MLRKSSKHKQNIKKYIQQEDATHLPPTSADLKN